MSSEGCESLRRIPFSPPNNAPVLHKSKKVEKPKGVKSDPPANGLLGAFTGVRSKVAGTPSSLNASGGGAVFL